MGLKQSKTSTVEPDPQSGDEWKTWYNSHLSISEIEKFKHRLNHIGHTLDENQSLKRNQSLLDFSVKKCKEFSKESDEASLKISALMASVGGPK